MCYAALLLSITLLCPALYAQPKPTESFGLSQRILATGLPYNSPQYGWAVAVDDGVMAVGAPNISASRGAVYLFNRDALGRWAYTQTLTLSSTNSAGFKLGEALTFHQGQLIVSAPRARGSDGQLGAGKVFVYKKEMSGDWSAAGEVTRPNNTQLQSFGTSLVSDGERLLVGAPNGLGRVLVYTQDAQGEWQSRQEISPPQAEDGSRFGWAMASMNGLIAITAPGYDSGVGKGHLFKFDGQEYKPLDTLNSRTEQPHGYGERVILTQDRLFISTRPTDSAGSVAVYAHVDGEQLTFRQNLTPQSSTFADNFGSGMAASPQWLAVASTGGKSQVSLWRRGADDNYKEELNLYTQTGVPLGGPTNTSPSLSGFGQTLLWSDDKLIVGSPFSSFSGEVFEFAPQRWLTRSQRAPTLNDEAFGQALAFARDQLLVGTPGRDDGGRMNTGGAYLLTRAPNESSGWSAPLPIFNGGSAPELRSGQTVAIDGSLIALGTPTANLQGGRVDVFQREGNGTWTFKTSILGEPGEQLGYALTFHQGQLLIGAPEYKNPPQEAIRFHGRVRIYKIEQGNVIESGVIVLPGRTRVGEALAQDGVRLVVGAPGIDDAAASSVIVYEWNGSQYSRKADLLGQENSGSFGRSVAISGTSLLVGQPGFKKLSSDEAAPRCEGRGLAYSFDLSRPNPENTRALIEPPSNQADTCFGLRLTLSKGRAFVSAPGHDEQGQLFIFSQAQGQWQLEQALENPTRTNQGGFARDFVVVDDAIFVSAANQQGGELYTFELLAELTQPTAESTLGDKLVVFTGQSSPGTEVKVELITGPDAGIVASVEVGSSASWQLPITLQDGTHSAQVLFEHVSGLTAKPMIVSFNLNSSLPAPPQITSPGPYTNSAKPIFEGSASTGLTIDLALKDAQQMFVAAGTSPVSQDQWLWGSPISLNDGQYTLEALAINSIGARSEVVTLNFTVDTIAPTAPTIDTIDLSTNPPKLSGSAEPGTTLTMEINLGDQRVMADIDQSGRWELVVPRLLNETQAHRVDVFSVDKAGNSSPPVSRPFAFAGVEIRESPNNTPALNGDSEVAQVIDVRITLTRDDDADFVRSYEEKTDAQGRWSLQIEEPLAPGVYTVLVEYLGTEQFELYKLRIPYVPDDFQRSYCMTSKQAPRSPTSGAGWLIFTLFGLALARSSARRRRQQG